MQYVWEHFRESIELPSRVQHSAVFEPESQRVWIMGGQSNYFLHPTRILQLALSSLTPLKVLAMEWVVNRVPLSDTRLLALPSNLRTEYKKRRSYRKHCFKMASGGECANWLCGREDAAMKKCSHCKTEHYCSRKCQQENWRVHKLTCTPASVGDATTAPLIERDLERFTARCAEECADWENSVDPYTRTEIEQMTLVLSNPWPSEELTMRYINDHSLHPTAHNYNTYAATFYNHTLAKELYNAAGIADRVLKMVAIAGWMSPL